MFTQINEKTLEVRSHDEIAYRALCLGTMLNRVNLEYEAHNSHPLGVSILRKKNRSMNKWMANQGIKKHLSTNELDLLNKPFGSWSDNDIDSVSWKYEQLGVILWSLSMLESLPGYDTQLYVPTLMDSLGIYKNKRQFMSITRLRSTNQIFWAREVAWSYLVSACFRHPELDLTMGIYKKENDRRLGTLVDITSKPPLELHQRGLIDSVPNGELPAFGMPFSSTSKEQALEVFQIAHQRYLAFRWILESHWDWDDTGFGGNLHEPNV